VLESVVGESQHKVWVKPSSEMTFLYGNHIIKGGVQRITEDLPQYAGVIVYSMSNAPLGFGVAAHAGDRLRDLDGTAVAVLHQSDVGEYLREEEALQ
jgi:60S ribosome subunit biogenesis protein NIP7